MKREFILAEIRRTAEANGGVAPGKLRFFTETGIKEADWSGKHWARWSDALREAGLQPNDLQRSYTDEHVLGHYASLLMAMDRIPTVPDLKLQARRDSSFPSHNTFARFGPKAALLARVHAYCRARPELTRAADLTLTYAEHDQPLPDEPPSPLPSDESFGTVYLIKSAGFYKIGRTNALGRREREITLQLPERSKTVHSIQTDDPVGIEAYWHRRFEAKRKNGEWFDLSASEIAAFRRRKFM